MSTGNGVSSGGVQGETTLPRTVVSRAQQQFQNQRQDRPASLYDNIRGAGGSTGALSQPGGGGISPSDRGATLRGGCHLHRLHNHHQHQINHNHLQLLLDESNPSQAHCLNTTVPQNIAQSAIAGRHTPTRNSLRHSRMIVLNRSGKVHRKHLPRVIHRYRLGRALAALQAIVGGAVTTLAMWLLIWAPRLPARDIPYWSGFPLLFSGILGLVLLCCCRKDYPGKPHSCHTFIFKAISIVVSILAGGACFCAGTFGVLHLMFLSKAACEPTNVLNATCVCRSVTDSENVLDITAKMYRYSDLNCPEVENILTVLLIGSSAANFIGGLLIAWYVYLHWSSRYSYVYSQVRTSENKPIIISNNKI